MWKSECIPLLERHANFQAITLLEHLQAKHEGQYPDRLLRTLQRRVKHWKATEGSEKEVMFMQVSNVNYLCRWTTIILAGLSRVNNHMDSPSVFIFECAFR